MIAPGLRRTQDGMTRASGACFSAGFHFRLAHSITISIPLPARDGISRVVEKQVCNRITALCLYNSSAARAGPR
jgi:hypothetical protein